jgi:alpha-mannosidase
LPKEALDKIMPGSLIEVRPRHLVVSALKKAEDRESLILRFYSPFETTDTAHVYVSSHVRFTHVYRCELNEQRRGDAALDVETLDDGSRLIKLVVSPKKIVTLELA